eukprot:5402660-Pyramimonas_sp.AAC.1
MHHIRVYILHVELITATMPSACRSTVANGPCVTSLPSCSAIVCPGVSSFWYMAIALTQNGPGSPDASSAWTNSAYSSSHACETIVRARSPSGLSSNARPTPCSLVRGWTLLSTTLRMVCPGLCSTSRSCSNVIPHISGPRPRCVASRNINSKLKREDITTALEVRVVTTQRMSSRTGLGSHKRCGVIWQ